MNNLVITRPRRQEKRTWGDRIYLPAAPIRQPLDAPDSRPEPKVSESILRQLQAPCTNVVNINSLPYGWQNMEAYADHVYVGRACPELNSDGYFGNPFHVGTAYPDFGQVTPATYADALRLYEQEFVWKYLWESLPFRQAVRALAGKVLVCHCKAYSRPGESERRGTDNPCHADILARYADRLALLQ